MFVSRYCNLITFNILFFAFLVDQSNDVEAKESQSRENRDQGSRLNKTTKADPTLGGKITQQTKPRLSEFNNKAIFSVRAANETVAERNYPRGEQDDYRAPFWNIAHMINSIDEIEPALKMGANGIETDISFDESGVPVETFHGFPCDCGRHCYSREKFVKFIQHLGATKTPFKSSYLQLVVLDLKLKSLNAKQKQVAGRHLASTIDEHVYRRYLRELKERRLEEGEIIQPPVRFIISINHIQDNVLIRSFLEYMRESRADFMSKQVGFDVGMNDNLTDISAMWNGFNGITLNIWQGDGLTNCANIVRGVERLKEAISIRNGQGHFRKIYYWTADVMYLIRSVLRLGVDAMLTNQPQRVVQVLQEPEFNSKYRLSTPYDDPFAQFWIKPSAWNILPPSISEAIETVANIRKTGEQYVKTLPNGIAVALQKVQESIIPNKS